MSVAVMSEKGKRKIAFAPCGVSRRLDERQGYFRYCLLFNLNSFDSYAKHQTSIKGAEAELASSSFLFFSVLFTQ